MQRLAATLEYKGREEGGENGRGFPLQRDGESLKGGKNLFATRSNDRSACWNSEYLCRLFFFFFSWQQRIRMDLPFSLRSIV